QLPAVAVAAHRLRRALRRVRRRRPRPRHGGLRVRGLDPHPAVHRGPGRLPAPAVPGHRRRGAVGPGHRPGPGGLSVMGVLAQVGDFTTPTVDYHALAPEIVLTAAIVILLLVDLLFEERSKWAASTIAGVGLLAACVPLLTLV